VYVCYNTNVAKKSHIWLSLQVPNFCIYKKSYKNGCKAGSIWKKKTKKMEERT